MIKNHYGVALAPMCEDTVLVIGYINIRVMSHEANVTGNLEATDFAALNMYTLVPQEEFF